MKEYDFSDDFMAAIINLRYIELFLKENGNGYQKDIVHHAIRLLLDWNSDSEQTRMALNDLYNLGEKNAF